MTIKTFTGDVLRLNTLRGTKTAFVTPKRDNEHSLFLSHGSRSPGNNVEMPTQIKTQKITNNFYVLDLRKTLLKVELHQFNHKNASDPKFTPKSAKNWP